MRDEILHEFRSQENLLGNLLEFIGDSIGMPIYPENKFSENSGCLKFGCTENSWKMLDHYY